jgi:hypothetical protein
MIALYIVLGLILLFFLADFVIYLITFRGRVYHNIIKTGEVNNDKFRPYKDDIINGANYANTTPYDNVYITSFDGLRLRGRLYKSEKEWALIILCHGYRSVAENDFSCAFEYFHKKGFSILMIDERAHHKSQGRTMTFGIKERWDVINWAQYAKTQFPNVKVIIEGISMGASTVLMAAGETLPRNVIAVIADCGYTSPGEIIQHVMRRNHLPVKIMYPMVKLAARLFGGFDLEECSCLEKGAKATLPALFIHGEGDKFVPPEMGKRNFEAYAGEKYMVTVPGAGHGMSYVVDTPKVKGALSEFLDRVLGDND